ncbi:MAG: hypothetical protein L0287_30085 [Anaerolineae bacterium]|nr:hypothetical protein [Anaerolineae bacterium]
MQEAHPTHRTALRFDLGDTTIRRNVVDRTLLPPGQSLVKPFESNIHNLQFSLSVGFRL